MARIKFPQRRRIDVADGVSITSVNPDWDREFQVVSKDDMDGIVVYRCQFREARPSPNGERYAFVGFVAVSAHGFTEASPVIGGEGWEGATRAAVGRIEAHECRECKAFVEFRTKSKRLGPECIKITTTCPKCGASDEDILD